MLILGLTGGIATGKSTVSHYFANEYHIPVIDADKIARDVVEPDTLCYNKIIKHFGPLIPDLTLVNGQEDNVDAVSPPLNRAALGAYVFSHRQDLKILNAITHPAIRKRILCLLFEQYVNKAPVVVLDVPLLFEGGLDWICSRVLTISCDSEKQLERLLSRNNELTPEQAENRIDSQMKLSRKIELSDYVVENNGGLDDLKENIDKFVKINLPALDINKPNNGWKWTLNNRWNLLQVYFPPFALLSAILALFRKSIFKLYY